LASKKAPVDVITIRAMAVFAEKNTALCARGLADRNYAETQPGVARAVITYYEQLAALYARYNA